LLINFIAEYGNRAKTCYFQQEAASKENNRVSGTYKQLQQWCNKNGMWVGGWAGKSVPQNQCLTHRLASRANYHVTDIGKRIWL